MARRCQVTGLDTIFLSASFPRMILRSMRKHHSFSARSMQTIQLMSSPLTLAEALWVLRRRLGFSIEQILHALRELLASDAMRFEHGDRLEAFLNGGHPTGRDVTDHLMAWSEQDAGCLRRVTVDKLAAKAIASTELLA